MANPGETWIPRLTRHEKQLIGLLGVAALFNQYDMGLLSTLLKHVQADLSIAEAELGFVGSAIRLGSLPTLLFAWLADRRGRRTLLLVTIAGYTLFTAITAFAPDARTSSHSSSAPACSCRPSCC